MIEERINVLIQSIDCLTAVINRLWDQKEDIKGIKAPPISADPPKPKTEKPKTEKPKEEKPEETVNPMIKELEDLCLNITRDHGPAKKKKTKAAIKKIIKDHGGEMLSDCPAENLPALKIALEGIA